MDIKDFTRSLAKFYSMSAVDQLIYIAWFVESKQNMTCFDGAYMRQCFRDVGVEPPDMSVYLPRLASKKPPQLTKNRNGYRLSGALRRTLDAQLGGNPTVIAVAKTLSNLPAQVPDLAEREFLKEALNCYKVQAYRAAIIMTWNLTYAHVAQWIFRDKSRIALINAGVASKYPKKGLVLQKIEDLDTLKESELIEAAKVCGLFDKNTAQILREKLGRRNMAAHPSRVAITQHSADDMITDLVNNVILKIR